MFFDHMRDMGHQVTFEMAVNPGAIKHYEDYFYDNIVFMAPSVKGKYLSNLNSNKSLNQYL